ncbi:MAG: ribonuclease D [Proteobacteria bacterium]|nr:ribonuclease D [Pseudomonadota bacterium]
MKLIETTDRLEALCKRLSTARFVTVDTEFQRTSTYYSKLCLIQVADDHGEAAIDTLAPGIDLSSFFDLITDGASIKVFHSAFQDLEIFFHSTGTLPKPIFDTQIAAMVCGYGDSVGYDNLVRAVTGQRVDKSMRFTDWTRRPLSKKQVDYALGDVSHLRQIYRHLEERLERNGRSSWIAGEMERLTNPETYRANPDSAWKRLKVKSGNRRFLARVQAVAAWRELQAIQRNLPRRRVVRDDILMDIAARAPKNQKELDGISGIAHQFRQGKAAESLLNKLAAAESAPESALPEPLKKGARREKNGPILDLLKVLLKHRCQNEGVAPRLVASAGDIEQLAAGQRNGLALLEGWRYDVYGRDAMKLLEGRLGLAADGDQLRFVEFNP